MSVFPKLAPTNTTLGPKFRKGWDLVAIDGNPLPGRARILSGGMELRVDEKGGPGQRGANPTFLGVKPRKIDIECVVWTQEQLDELKVFCDTYAPAAAKDPFTASIQAPQLLHLPTLASMVCIAISPIEFASEFGLSGRKVKFTWLHWQQPTAKSANTTPKKAPVRKPTNTQQQNAAATNQANSNPPPNQSVSCGPPAGPVR